MASISTYVFLDLETTGLPQNELNKTRITELSMVAVKTAHLLVARPGMAPRVQNKLSLCFNPLRMIEPGCTEVTGLCNDQLEHEASFDKDAFTIINKFIERLESPVCFVAHNGYGFDYPILKNHFVSLGVSLSEDILCTDSFHVFYDILEKRNDSTCDAKPEPSSPTKETTIASADAGVTEMQLKNETTPRQQMTQDTMPITPSKFPENKKVVVKARRKLPWSDGDRPMVSYRLKSVYERLLNRPAQNTHRAEGDCLLLLESVAAVAKSFVGWVNDGNNHKKFCEIKPMTLGVPLGE